jgi:hypothetical protein
LKVGFQGAFSEFERRRLEIGASPGWIAHDHLRSVGRRATPL